MLGRKADDLVVAMFAQSPPHTCRPRNVVKQACRKACLYRVSGIFSSASSVGGLGIKLGSLMG